MKPLLLILLLVACSREHPHKPQYGGPSSQLAELEAAFAGKHAAYLAATDETGWPSTTDCDATKFAGQACAAGVDVAIDLAEYSPGEIHRRPAPACWNKTDGDVGSKSTVSNDMILGWLACKWARRDYEAIRRLAHYGEVHSWVMGEPTSELGRVVLKPNQIGLVGRMLYALSNGRDDRIYRRTYETYLPVGADYERHLQAIGIHLQGEVNEALRTGSLDATVEGGAGEKGEGALSLLDLTSEMRGRLDELVAAEPTNPLFHAVLGTYTGDCETAPRLLLDPATPVPTYVRGDRADNYALAEWLHAARIVLKRCANQPSGVSASVAE